MKFPILKTGLVRWANDTKTHFGGELSIYKWLKRALGYANVPYADPCCDLDVDQPVPMRFNPSNLTTEFATSLGFELFSKTNASYFLFPKE